MTALTEDRNTEYFPEGSQLVEEVEAAAVIFSGSLVNRASTGYCKPAGNTAGERIAGVADHKADNAAGASGDETIRLLRKVVPIFAATGLTIADVGKPLWVVDDQTVSRTPGHVFCGVLAYFVSATEAPVDMAPALAGLEPLELLKERRVPTDIQTAAFAPVVAGVWENVGLVALLNAATLTDILTGRAVVLRGTLEIINAAAVVRTVLFADGDTPSGIDKVKEFTTLAAIGSEFLDVALVTDASGQFKCQVSHLDVSLKFHLQSYRYAENAAVA